MTCFEDVAKLLQFNVILNLIHLGYIWYLPKIIRGTVKGQGSPTYYPYPYPQVPLPITLKGYPYPCYCLDTKDTQIHGYLNARIPGYLNTCVHGYMNNRIPGYLNTCVHGYMNT